MPAGDQPVDDAGGPVRPQDEVGPALAGVYPPVRVGHGLKGARHCRADGDHTAACSSGRGNKSRGGRRDAVPLGRGWFVGLLRGDTRVQRDRGNGDPGSHQLGHQFAA